jgi:hypothetical protein
MTRLTNNEQIKVTISFVSKTKNDNTTRNNGVKKTKKTYCI